MKRLIGALVALCLVASAALLPMAALASEGENIFIPEVFVRLANQALETRSDAISAGLSLPAKKLLTRTYRLAPSDDADDSGLLYDDANADIEAYFYYGEGASFNASTACPAIMFSYASGARSEAVSACHVMLSHVIAQYVPRLDEDSMLDWLNSTAGPDDVLDLDGALLTVIDEDGSRSYLITAPDSDEAPVYEPTSYPTPIVTEVPTPIVTEVPTPVVQPASDAVLVSWQGFSAELLSVSYWQSTSDPDFVTLDFYCRFVNQSSREIDMFVRNVTVDGVEARGVGEMDVAPGTDTGANSSEYFFLKAETAEARAAFATARYATMTFEIYAEGLQGCQYSQTVTLPVGELMDASGTSPVVPQTTPQPTAAPAPAAASDDVLIDQNGFRVELLSIEPFASSDGEVQLDFYCRFINRSGHSLNMFVDDVTVNGASVKGVGEMAIENNSDSGADSREYFFVKSEDAAGRNAICNALTMTCTLRIVERENYTEYMRKTITIPLVSVPAFTPKPVQATATPAPTASYPTLSKGDRGDAVAALQRQLIALGYLNDSADGIFGGKTEAAVREFQRVNGLSISGVATPETQAKLFSDSALGASSMAMPLWFPDGSRGEWQFTDDNYIKMRVKVTNASQNKTVKSFELYMYALDSSGTRIYGEDTVYYATTTRTIAPGEAAFSEYMTMRDGNRVNQVYAGVHKVTFTDGTSIELKDYNVTYSYWTITH